MVACTKTSLWWHGLPKAWLCHPQPLLLCEPGGQASGVFLTHVQGCCCHSEGPPGSNWWLRCDITLCRLVTELVSCRKCVRVTDEGCIVRPAPRFCFTFLYFTSGMCTIADTSPFTPRIGPVAVGSMIRARRMIWDPPGTRHTAWHRLCFPAGGLWELQRALVRWNCATRALTGALRPCWCSSRPLPPALPIPLLVLAGWLIFRTFSPVQTNFHLLWKGVRVHRHSAPSAQIRVFISAMIYIWYWGASPNRAIKLTGCAPWSNNLTLLCVFIYLKPGVFNTDI